MEATTEPARGGWKLSDPGKPTRGILLTARDLAMLHDLYSSRFMHANQFKALYGEKAGRRLLQLARHEYVLRSDAAWIWRLHRGGGSKPQVYELGHKGAVALAEARIIPWDAAKRWSEKNRRVKSTSMFLPHTLAVADVRTAFRVACLCRGLPFISGELLTAGTSPRTLTIPGRASAMFTDDTFAIGRAGKEPALFFVEVDRDTESNHTGRISAEGMDADGFDLDTRTAESFGRKFGSEGYFAYARAERQIKQFGIKNFRVLTITTGGERKVLNLAATIGFATHGVEARRYLTTNFTALAVADPLAAPWVDATGSVITLQL